MKKISVIIGTRPEAIKLAPVVLGLRTLTDVRCHVCLTAQHREMLDQMLEVFQIRHDTDLNLMTADQTLGGLTARAVERLDSYFAAEKPDLVLVQGDTTTVFCATLAAFYHRVPVGHVEAGLRTGDLASPWPEEANRVLTSRLASMHFAPTMGARQNLLRESIPRERIFVTGNTGIDALFLVLQRQRGPGGLEDPNAAWNGDGRMVLITAHRRENFGRPFEEVCSAIAELARRFTDTTFFYPVHPNPNVVDAVDRVLRSQTLPNVRLIEPLSYPQFVSMMSRAVLIITDSGGVQEEAPSLGKPVLVVRETTERPEAVDAGSVRVIGPRRGAIVDWVTRLLTDATAYAAMSHAYNPYGDGHAAPRIVRICRDFLGLESDAPAPAPFESRVR